MHLAFGLDKYRSRVFIEHSDHENLPFLGFKTFDMTNPGEFVLQLLASISPSCSMPKLWPSSCAIVYEGGFEIVKTDKMAENG